MSLVQFRPSRPRPASEERAHHELARLDVGDLVADLLYNADVLMAHRDGSVGLLESRGRATGPTRTRRQLSRGGWRRPVGDGGTVAVLDSDVAGGVEDGSSHHGVLVELVVGVVQV